jgi:type II secretory ATPase GspE/PulE/Tfp pilus assembly ATPase PilB-like protein
VIIITKLTDEEKISRFKSLKLTEEEERELLEYDKTVDATNEKLEFDLTDEQNKIAQSYVRTGTRKNVPKKSTRKANATKAGIIAELASFLTNGTQYETSDIQITNAEREILLKICGKWYSVTLMYKTKMNKEN